MTQDQAGAARQQRPDQSDRQQQLAMARRSYGQERRLVLDLLGGFDLGDGAPQIPSAIGIKGQSPETPRAETFCRQTPRIQLEIPRSSRRPFEISVYLGTRRHSLVLCQISAVLVRLLSSSDRDRLSSVP